MAEHPAKGSIKFMDVGYARITAMKLPEGVKVSISNNIETKASIFLSKDEALRLALELLTSIQSMES